MPNYFKPLGRNIGILTLAMACVLSVIWIRSLSMIDSFNRTNRGTGYRVMSVDGRIELRIASHAEIALPSKLESRPLGDRRVEEQEIAKRIVAAKRLLEVLQEKKASFTSVQFDDLASGIKKSLRELEATQPSYAIPYWTIVIPLTLLSAWLLLSQPPTKTMKSFA